MGDLDELSRVIGNIEGKQDAMLSEQKSQSKEITEIKKAVVDNKVTMAYYAGVMGAAGTAVVLFLKKIIYGAL